MRFRYSTKADITEIVKIHKMRFDNFFLTSLGDRFLDVYYKSFLKKPGILIVLEDERCIKGFACGNISNKGFYKKLLLKNIGDFSLIGLKLLFTKPLSIFRIFFNLKNSEKDNIVYAELLSIATLPNKKGYGSFLLKSFEEEIKKCNYFETDINLSLTTDYYNNDKTVDFYKSNNYKELRVFDGFKSRKMYQLIKKI